MMNKKSAPCVLLIVVLVAAIGGCTGKSQPTRFYTLTSTLEDQVQTEKISNTNDLSIGIGPLKVADYLPKSRIVTRVNGNKIDQAEFDQWSGSLKNNVINVLADNIGHFLNTEQVAVHPWRSFIQIDYQVVVEIIRFDGELGDKVRLEARYIVLKGNDKIVILTKRSRIQESVDAPGYAGFVAAQSRAMEKLSNEIAESVAENFKI